MELQITAKQFDLDPTSIEMVDENTISIDAAIHISRSDFARLLQSSASLFGIEHGEVVLTLDLEWVDEDPVAAMLQTISDRVAAERADRRRQ